MTWRVACALDELDERPLAVDVVDDHDEQHELAIVADQGRYYAIRNECSHARVELSEGDVEDGAIECYLHGSRFDLATGRALNLPATEPVPVYPTRTVGGDLEVDLDNPLTF